MMGDYAPYIVSMMYMDDGTIENYMDTNVNQKSSDKV